MFTYNYTFNVAFGPGAIEQIGPALNELKCKKALICCDEGIVKFGLLKVLTDVLDEWETGYCVYDRVLPNPPERNVTEAADMAKENNVDCLIAIGGGSSIDTAKAANILLFNDPPLQMWMYGGAKDGLPLIAVPTTSGTGSDLSVGAMITGEETHRKYAVATPSPTLSVCDPELTRTLPAGATLAGAVDALAHAIEAYTSESASKYSDLICENCIRTVVKFLPKVQADPGDMTAREELMFASSSAGSTIATSCLHIGHAVGHAIGGSLDIVHGISVAVVMPQMLKFLSESIPEKIRRIGEFLDIDIPGDADAKRIGDLVKDGMISHLKAWNVRCLKDMGYSLEDLCSCIPTIMEDFLLNFSPACPEEDDIRDMILSAYDF